MLLSMLLQRQVFTHNCWFATFNDFQSILWLLFQVLSLVWWLWSSQRNNWQRCFWLIRSHLVSYSKEFSCFKHTFCWLKSPWSTYVCMLFAILGTSKWITTTTCFVLAWSLNFDIYLSLWMLLFSSIYKIPTLQEL